MRITAHVQGVEELSKAMQAFADAVGKDVAAILPDEARLFAMSGMTAQPPTAGKESKNGGGKVWGNGNTKAAQRNGEAAVERSGMNASPHMTPDWFYDPELKKRIQAGKIQGTQWLLDRAGISIKVGAFDEAYWESKRDYKGRVFRMKRGNVIIRQQDVAAREAAIKKRQARVGMMKGAWAHIVEKLNRHTAAKSKIPSWIARHSARGAAWLQSETFISLMGAKKSIRIRGANHPTSVAFTGIAIKSRIKSIQKKTREVLRGRAAIINGKFTIFKHIK